MQSAITAGSMRIEQVMMFLPGFFHSFANLLVGICSSRNLSGNVSMRTAIQVKHTSKVARITHVHSVGNGCNGWAGIIFTCLQVLIEYIVAIVGSNKTFDRQAHLFAEQSGCDVSEVSARNTNHGIIGFSGTLQLCISIEIIECLRQEAGYIDRIGGSQ